MAVFFVSVCGVNVSAFDVDSFDIDDIFGMSEDEIYDYFPSPSEWENMSIDERKAFYSELCYGGAINDVFYEIMGDIFCMGSETAARSLFTNMQEFMVFEAFMDEWYKDKYASMFYEYQNQFPYRGILQFDEHGNAMLDNGCYLKVVMQNQYTDQAKREDKYYTFFYLILYSASNAEIKKIDMYDDMLLTGSRANLRTCYSSLGTVDGVLGYELMDGTTGTYAIRLRVYDAALSNFTTKTYYFGLTSALLGDDADSSVPINPDTTDMETDDYSDEYINDFFQWFGDNVVNNYGDEINFDTSGIVEALESVYAKLHSILTAMQDGFDKVVKKLDAVIGRLENVISAVMKINSLELTQAFLLGEDFDTFDELTYKEMVATALETKFSFVACLSDLCNNALSSYSKTTESPVIKFKMEGVLLEQKINFKVFDDYIDEMRYIIAAFVYVSFSFNTYRRIPSYINNGGER